jgi:uncharacterized membrane protein
VLTYFHMHDVGWGWGLLMGVGWLAIWAAIVVAGVALWRNRRNESPTDVLDHRLARGEISIEEHERLRRAITRPS